MRKNNTRSSSDTILTHPARQYKSWLFRLLLVAITFFAIFLRFEDFAAWEKNRAGFQYRGEFQMANFDSYYYLQIAKEIQQGTYDHLQENRRVPNGVDAPVIPPLIAITTVVVGNVFSIPISTVAIFLPVFLASLLAPLVYLVGRKLNYNQISALAAALFSIISLAYVIRTRIGVFDTDSLNVVFVLLHSYLFFLFAEIKSNKRYIYLGLGLLSTCLFYTWWNTATSVVVLSALLPLSVALIFFYKTKRVVIEYSVLVLIFLAGTYFVSDQLIVLFNLVFDTVNTDFPRNMSVAELNSVSISEFTKKTTNNSFLLLCMSIGWVALSVRLKLKALFFIVPFLLAIAAFVAGNRFIMFAAPILALGMGYGIQMLFSLKALIKPPVAVGITVVMICIGIASSYKTITDKVAKPAAFENTTLLNALDEYTPKGANIWTDWDLGYQIQYYLQRGTYADGGFSDGEISYYASFPLATDNLDVSANFMRFYNKHGIKGMNVLYESFSGVENTFSILRELLSLSPAEATRWFANKEKNGQLPGADNLTTPKQWTAFLFPRESEDIYVFIHYKMTQTASWFKQGNSDLKTGQTKGLPLFLTFQSLQEQGPEIKNNQITLNTKTGVARYLNQPRYFQSLSTFNGTETETKRFAANYPKFTNASKDDRFVFQWNKKIGFGAAMSKEMANTTLVKLYLLQEKSPYFQPVAIHTPWYQVWKVTGNAYSKNIKQHD